MPDFSHFDDQNKVSMVDVSGKEVTSRTAVAEGRIYLKEAYEPAKSNHLKKGDLLSTATIAGIQAAKQTSALIPLCHQIPLSSVKLSFFWEDETASLHVTATTRTDAQTGVEMEALTAVSLALLTVYDMVKAVCKTPEISGIRLLEKTGGKSGDFFSQSR
ncbi:MAG: cyclic pyranopterin monophosphate synthase MoaC [Bacteroidetes bacterium]|nr:cyclic pyranopterin monophosphate synthase MoaC [Bacteroidota bacterium]